MTRNKLHAPHQKAVEHGIGNFSKCGVPGQVIHSERPSDISVREFPTEASL